MEREYNEEQAREMNNLKEKFSEIFDQTFGGGDDDDDGIANISNISWRSNNHKLEEYKFNDNNITL